MLRHFKMIEKLLRNVLTRQPNTVTIDTSRNETHFKKQYGDHIMEELKALLRSGYVEVTFTKKDGTVRVMQCTTNLGNIPETQHPTSSVNYSSNQVRVYDIENGAWRSFLFDNLLEYRVLHEQEVKVNLEQFV